MTRREIHVGGVRVAELGDERLPNHRTGAPVHRAAVTCPDLLKRTFDLAKETARCPISSFADSLAEESSVQDLSIAR